MDATKLSNRALFAVSVVLTGALAGAFVWLLLFVMNLGITFVWTLLPAQFGPLFPLAACLIGGLVIGLYAKRFGSYPEELDEVMSTVRRTGRYEYDKIGIVSVAALLPLFFGGSVGPEAGLTGAIAGICTWVGDRMKRFGSDFRQLTSVGTMATISAIFTAPLFGFVAPLGEKSAQDGSEAITIPRTSKVIVYFCAIAGALGTFLGLSTLFGGGLSLPHYQDIALGGRELAWLIPLALVGCAAGWLYGVLDGAFTHLSQRLGDRPVQKTVIAGFVLALCGIALPFTMFAGETQAEQIGEVWMSMGVLTLLATGFLKVFATCLCIRFGWRGGHFFPLIFAGISLGYGMATVSGADPVFCLCACTSALMGAVMRKPFMAVLLLFLCFPVKGVFVMIACAALGAAVPLPKAFHRSPAPQIKENERPEK